MITHFDCNGEENSLLLQLDLFRTHQTMDNFLKLLEAIVVNHVKRNPLLRSGQAKFIERCNIFVFDNDIWQEIALHCDPVPEAHLPENSKRKRDGHHAENNR